MKKVLFWLIFAPILFLLSFSLYTHVLFESELDKHPHKPNERPPITEEYNSNK